MVALFHSLLLMLCIHKNNKHLITTDIKFQQLVELGSAILRLKQASTASPIVRKIHPFPSLSKHFAVFILLITLNLGLAIVNCKNKERHHTRVGIYW